MKIADISQYQGVIDWNKAREKLELVIFRASVGDAKDTKYVSNAQNCGVPFGVYHYCKAGTKAQAKQEAQFFYKCATTNGLKPLFFVADIEHSTQNSKTTKDVTYAFAAELRSLGATKLGLYIGQDRYPYADRASYDFIWIPRYGKNDGTTNEKYKPIYGCDLWQYTDKGKVAGIKGYVDLNKFNGGKAFDWFIDDDTAAAAPKELKKGDTGTEVLELQKQLNKVMYAGLEEDGEFGSETEKAVKKLQEKNSLNVDGIFNEASRAALTQMLIAPANLTTCRADYIYYSDSSESVPFTTIEKNRILTAVLDSNGKPIVSSNGYYAVRAENKIGWIHKQNIVG